MVGFTLSGSLSNFTRPSDNRLQYNGAATVLVMAIASLNITAVATTSVSIAITKNGAAPSNGSAVQGALPMTAGISANFSPSTIVSLATSDYLSVWVLSTVATTISVANCTLSAKS